jgi:hypothetical protein
MRDAILYEYRLIEEGTADTSTVFDIEQEESDDSEEDSTKKWEKVEVCRVKFHAFGVNYEEFNSNIGIYSSAIIEMPDGMLENVPVELIQLVPDGVTLQ